MSDAQDAIPPLEIPDFLRDFPEQEKRFARFHILSPALKKVYENDPVKLFTRFMQGVKWIQSRDVHTIVVSEVQEFIEAFTGVIADDEYVFGQKVSSVYESKIKMYCIELEKGGSLNGQQVWKIMCSGFKYVRVDFYGDNEIPCHLFPSSDYTREEERQMRQKKLLDRQRKEDLVFKAQWLEDDTRTVVNKMLDAIVMSENMLNLGISGCVPVFHRFHNLLTVLDHKSFDKNWETYGNLSYDRLVPSQWKEKKPTINYFGKSL